MPPHTIVMTGATRGIGRVAAEHLLCRSPEAHLVIVARDPSGWQLARTDRVVADLNSLADARSAATEIGDRLDSGDVPPLRHFVGNAAVQHTNNLTAGPEGIESTFMVNLLANHVFVRALENRFVTGGRVVITASDTHFGDLRHNMAMVPGPVWKSPDVLARSRAFSRPETARAGRTAYSTSKLAVIHLVHEYARRLPSGIDVLAYNPGFVPGTGLGRHASLATRFLLRRVLPLLAFTPCATHREDAGQFLADAVLGTRRVPTGSYIDRSKPSRSSAESYDPRREKELWEFIELLRVSTN